MSKYPTKKWRKELKYLYGNVYTSIFLNSQKAETTKVSTEERIKQNVL